MSNLQAAIGLAQIEAVEDHLTRKRRIAALYSERLRKIKGLCLQECLLDVWGCS
jgi:dTDP-4-amino-4,6-dideoxygalactose transaminase